MGLHDFDVIAAKLFRAAMDEGRCGELLVCLWAGGSASIDDTGHLVTGVGAPVMTELDVDQVDEQVPDGPLWCDCGESLVERLPLFRAAQCGRCYRAIRPGVDERDATPAHGLPRPMVPPGSGR